MGRKILCAILKLGCTCNLGTLGAHAQIKLYVTYPLCSKFHIKIQLQVVFVDEEICDSSSNDGLADKCAQYAAAAEHSYQDAFQLDFGSSRPGKIDKDGNQIITVIDRTGIHKIGVRWCCCPDAAGHDMQMMVAGLF